jgi:MATE family multidrug resistance protein
LHIVLKSIPLVLQNIFNMLAYWIFFVMIEKMGSAELRVSLIVRSLYLFLCLPVFGLGRAVNTVVSNFIGRKDVGNVGVAIRKSHQIALVIGVILCALVYFFPTILLNIYTNDTELINDAIPILNVLIVSLFLFSVSTVNTNIIIATGKTNFVFITGVISIVGYLVFAYVSIFSWNEELPFIWLSDWVNWSIFTVMSSLYILLWWRREKDVFLKSKISLAE